jgi:Trk-type K+ transport system membrane component
MMFMGRVGILTFGVFLSLREENEDEDNQKEEELVL